MDDVITLFLAGFVLALGGMTVYWCIKTIIDNTLALIEELKFQYWRWKKSR